MQAVLYSTQETKIFAGKLTFELERTGTGETVATSSEIELNENPVISEEDQLCVMRRYFLLDFYEYGDLRSLRDGRFLYESIGQKINTANE